MVTIQIPNRTGGLWQFEAIVPEVWIAGLRRTDAQCKSVTLGDNGGFGSAVIHFPEGGYDSEFCRENDLVEIKVRPMGTIFRGYIHRRESEHLNELTQTAIDLMAKLDAMIFWEHEYSTIDEVTKEVKYDYTMREIAADAYGYYLSWHAVNCPGDYLLKIDLESFPEDVPNETKVTGQGLMQGLQGMLEGIDFRYRIRIDHDDTGSTIRAYILGAGEQRPIGRGVDPRRSWADQPGGPALAVEVRKTVDSKDCFSHIYAEGAERVIESAFELSPDWNEVADDFTPPEGDSILNHVTVDERVKVTNNWDKFTKEQIDLKESDKFGSKATNPNYRKKYESICRRYKIPKIADLWKYLDSEDPDEPEFGESERQVKIESELVQEYDGQKLDHFVVFKRQDDESLYVMMDGFSVKDNQTVEFSKPLLDSVSTVPARGTHGEFKEGSWDAEACTSQYDVNADEDVSLDVYTHIAEGNDPPLWLVLPEIMAAYKITACVGDVFTVVGNLDGAGLLKEPLGEGEEESDDPVETGKRERGAHWFVTTEFPYRQDGQGNGTGTGLDNGRYQINPSGDEAISNEFAGMFLVVGSYDWSKVGWSSAPKDLKSFRIAYNSKKMLYLDSIDANLTGAPADWWIVNPRTELKRPVEQVWLNASWKSLQKLAWYSGDLAGPLNKRITPKSNTVFEWRTERGNFRLVKVSDPGLEDQYEVVFNAESVDATCDFEDLAAWAANQINGANAYKIEYAIALGLMDFSLKIGTRPLDNRVDSGATIVSITYDFDGQRQTIQATSWS